MKKLAAVAALASVLFLSGCDSLSGPDIQNNDLVQPTHEYEIDTWGTNSEVYEFTPRSNPNKTCVVFMLDNMKAMDMECFPKE